MKFTIQFLTVLAATTSLAVPINEKNLIKCNKAIEIKYNDCSEFLLEGYDEESCVVIESELCQKFYNGRALDLINEIPECKDVLKGEDIKELEKQEKEAEQYKLFYINLAKYKCARDEQGNLCLYTPSNLHKVYNYKSTSSTERDAIITKAIKDSCKSKKCVDTFLSVEEQSDKFSFITNESQNKENPEMKELISYLKSETCTAQNIQTSGNVDGKTNDTNGNLNGIANGQTNGTNSNANGNAGGNAGGKTDATSGATQVTYSSILIIGLAVLLTALY